MQDIQSMVEVINGATQAARARYIEWSDGWHLEDAAEHFLAYEIASAIYQKFGRGSVTVETPIELIYENAEHKPKGRPAHAERRYGRADIVHWLNDKPFAVIEVKFEAPKVKVLEDLDRIAALIKRRAIQAGVSAYYLSYGANGGKSGQQRLDQYLGGLRLQIAENYGDAVQLNVLSGEATADGETWAWAMATVVLTKGA